LEGYDVITARETAEAMSHIGERVDLAISDLKMGSQSGIDLLQQWKAQRPETPFVMVTAYADVDSAVTAMKLGAKDYLAKPIDPVELVHLVSRLLEERALNDRASGTADERLIGESAAMRDVFVRIERAAQSDSTVLILGESGTGKELVAKAIHRASRRKHEPFVAFSLCAMSEELVEAELFGHATGAGQDIGVFQRAKGGTLLIDEIGDCPPGIQAKLLRALETQRVTPVGGAQERAVSVRVIATTSRGLDELMAARRLRDDLYYRLNLLAIDLPPLRERRSDIPLLVNHFLEECCRANARKKPRLSADLLRFMEQFAWPGNVRQLRHAVESMVVMAQGDFLTLEDLPSHLGQPGAAEEAGAVSSEATTLENLEKAAVLQALERTQGNRTHAAGLLGISIRTLQRKLKAWGLANER
jgi:DNA-binding NtrC family response regulator